MRMMENGHQQLSATAAYRMNEHTPNVIVENLIPEKIGTDEDDDDTELLGDDEISSRFCRSNNGEMVTSPRGGRLDNDKRMRREIANSNERRRMQSINAGFQSLKALLPRRDGEKMSKASILQQTADFIRSLQTEKDSLMQQSTEMKHLMGVNVLKTNLHAMEKTLTPSCIPKTEAPISEKRYSGEYGMMAMDTYTSIAPPKKRRKFENDSADEGVGMMSDAEAIAAPRTSPRNNSTFLPVVSTAIAITQTDPPCVTIDAACCTTPPPPPPAQQQQLGESKPIESSIVQEKLWEIELLQRQLIELRLALDRERRLRSMLEEQMRILELNRLQTLARLQSVPLLEYNMSHSSANSNVAYPCAVSSPLAVVNPLSPPLLRPLSTATPINNVVAVTNACATVSTTSISSLNSLPNPVTSRNIPTVVSQPSSTSVNDGGVLSLPTIPSNVSECHRPTISASLSPPPTSKQAGQANANNQLYQSHSSKQSLAAIVEAIRHLEGDQLFVDVELQRPVAQQQSMTVSAVVSTTTGGPTVVTNHCQAIMGAIVGRPDYTDSGISSPVSERQVFSGSMPNFGMTAGTPTTVVPMLMTPANDGGGTTGSELNHVVAATAAALHNLCFPYTNPQQLGASSSSSSSRQHQQFQQQVRQHPAGWTSATLQ